MIEAVTTFPDIDALPQDIPVFPLEGVLLLPRGQLPLNIFEPRYVAMVDDALKNQARMIGMIQPRDAQSGSLFRTGCAGRITTFEELGDNRYLICLTGICRFNIDEELPLQRGYRSVKADWSSYGADLQPQGCLDLDRDRLKNLLKNYFDIQGISCSLDVIDAASDEKLITALSMICPFEAKEKQALLEAACCRKRSSMFMTMLEMAVRDGGSCGGGGCH